MPTVEDLTFDRVSEFYLAELRRGAAQPVEDYALAFPHLANEIREYFPSMSLLEQHPPAQDDRDGLSRIGTCLIEEEIGRGAMGAVYKAFQPRLDRHVAVKVMRLASTDQGSANARFEKECRAMGRLDHPNIVPVYEHGCDGERSFLVMKLIEGKSLDRLIVGSPDYRCQMMLFALHADWSLFATVAAQVADALSHAHERGIIHRDIKPGNLLLDENCKPWITDFGIAKLQLQESTCTQTRALIGTPRYMAPEQFRGVSDARTDIYALGLTLYDVALGKRSSDTLDTSSGDATIDTGGLPPLSTLKAEVPQGLSKIVAKACALSPDERYQSAGELREVLLRFAEGKSPADRRSKRRPSDSDYRRRSRRVTLAIGVLSLVAIGGVGASQLWAPVAKVASRPTVSRQSPKASAFLETISSPDSKSETSVIEAFVNEIAAPVLPRKEGAAIGPQADADPIVAETSPQEIKDRIHSAVDKNKHKLSEETRASVDEAINSDRLDDLRVSDLVDAYRQTSLPAATRLMNRATVVQRSGLSDAEKRAAMHVIKLYSTAIVNRYIPEVEANIAIDVLTEGRAVSAADLDAMMIPDRTVRSWLGMLQNRVRTLPITVETERPKVEDELRGVLERALRSHEERRGAP